MVPQCCRRGPGEVGRRAIVRERHGRLPWRRRGAPVGAAPTVGAVAGGIGQREVRSGHRSPRDCTPAAARRPAPGPSGRRSGRLPAGADPGGGAVLLHPRGQWLRLGLLPELHLRADPDRRRPRVEGRRQGRRGPNILLIGDDHRPANASQALLAQLGTQQDGGGINTDTMLLLHLPAQGGTPTASPSRVTPGSTSRATARASSTPPSRGGGQRRRRRRRDPAADQRPAEHDRPDRRPLRAGLTARLLRHRQGAGAGPGLPEPPGARLLLRDRPARRRLHARRQAGAGLRPPAARPAARRPRPGGAPAVLPVRRAAQDRLGGHAAQPRQAAAAALGRQLRPADRHRARPARPRHPRCRACRRTRSPSPRSRSRARRPSPTTMATGCRSSRRLRRDAGVHQPHHRQGSTRLRQGDRGRSRARWTCG